MGETAEPVQEKKEKNESWPESVEGSKQVKDEVKNKKKEKKPKEKKDVAYHNEEPSVQNKEEPNTEVLGNKATETGEEDVSEWKKLFVCEALVSALERKGFKTPTPIQRLTLPAALKGKMDIVGAAETGSGKTLAFGLPIIQGILEDREYEKTHGQETESVDVEVDQAEQEEFV